jgi:hypothetical protein
MSAFRPDELSLFGEKAGILGGVSELSATVRPLLATRRPFLRGGQGFTMVLLVFQVVGWSFEGATL